jgi:hypothetical protein
MSSPTPSNAPDLPADPTDHARARVMEAIESLGAVLDGARQNAAAAGTGDGASYASAAEAALAARLAGARAALDCARRSVVASPAAAAFWRGAVVAGDAAAAAAVVAGAAGGAVRGAAVVRALGRVVDQWEWRRMRLAAAAAGDVAAAADLARRARRRFRRAVAEVLGRAAESADWPEMLRSVAPSLRAAVVDLDALGWPID